jgi:hypothetical protein
MQQTKCISCNELFSLPPLNIPILPLVEKFGIRFPNFFFCLEYELWNVFSKYFAEFTLGKVWKTHSELLIQGQNCKIGGGGRFMGGEENFSNCFTTILPATKKPI